MLLPSACFHLAVFRPGAWRFYNPALYKAPERRELTEEERIYVNSGGADPRDAEEAVPKGGIAGTGVTARRGPATQRRGRGRKGVGEMTKSLVRMTVRRCEKI